MILERKSIVSIMCGNVIDIYYIEECFIKEDIC